LGQFEKNIVVLFLTPMVLFIKPPFHLAIHHKHQKLLCLLW